MLAGVMLAGLCLPAAALAGTYSWDLPANFTATSPGANPDHDAYGAAPWSYLEGPAALPAHGSQPQPGQVHPAATVRDRDPRRPRGLERFRRALVATNPSSTTLTDGTDTFPAGQLAITPPIQSAWWQSAGPRRCRIRPRST